MMDSVETTLGFLDRLRAQNRRTFPGVNAEKVISFMGTTASRGTHLDVSVARVWPRRDGSTRDRSDGQGSPHASGTGERVPPAW
jgi:hypothetical protein